MHILIIGGGVIGLSLAWELAQRKDLRVTLLDRQDFGTEASWAGAGILPPANRETAVHPYDQLRGLAMDLHPRWAERLRELTGIDTGFRQCGGVYLARTRGEAAALAGMAGELRDQQIPIERLTPAELAEVEPELATLNSSDLKAAYHLPTECQLRNPHHLQALIRACELAGVELRPQTEVIGIESADGCVQAVRTSAGELVADRVCITAGSWSQGLLHLLGIETGILPIRGQMVLYRCARPPLKCVVNEGSRYLVPRLDGHLLVGSTEEEVGFDKSTTPDEIAGLRAYAESLVPALRQAEVIRTWAGLRPASFDGFPYLGRASGWENLYVAAGHFRSGLYLSPATAVVMSQVLADETPAIDLAPFRTGR